MKRNIIALLVVVVFAVSICGVYAASKCPMSSGKATSSDKAMCPVMSKGSKNSNSMTEEQKAKCMKMKNCPMTKGNSKSLDNCKNGVCPIPAKSGSKVSKKVVSAVCPVMGNRIPNIKKAAGKSVYNGKTYYFCCPQCKPKFDRNPAKYVN